MQKIQEILANYTNRILSSKILPARKASFAVIPEEMNPELKECIRQMGYEQLYSHQAEMYKRAIQGKSVVITTGTASGKSLSFYLPVIQRILENPSRRALFIYPTKALTKDQLRNIVEFVEYFGKHRIQAGIYDGDTPASERSKIREEANIILTNPDMINATFLPNHNRYGFPHLFANLDFIVIDELHAYRGAFGSHVSNVMRRLLRVCNYHGNTPRFLCSSATIANPAELAENICHQAFELIEKDGSPAPEKEIHFWQPEYIKEAQRKRSVTEELKGFLPDLIENCTRVITFCMSRRETEVVTKECRDILAQDPLKLGPDFSDKISAYRGGYTPLERAKIEKDLVDGKIYGVVSTSALELGIDIGALDMVVMGGFPGTRASFWQQLGRAGRNGNKAHAVLMLKEKPMDQYVGMNPNWLLESESENAVIDKNNLYIQLAHIRAASAELPLSIDDIASFPDLGEIIPLLQKEGEISEHNAQYQWSGQISPAHEISLRNITSDTIKIVDREKEKTITTVDLVQAKKEFYSGAIYLHDSIQYKSLDLDLESKTAWVKEVDSNYYTEPHKPGTIDILMEHEQNEKHRIYSCFGDVRVSVLVSGYKMVQFNSHQNLGYEGLNQILQTQMETEACWIQIPDNVVHVFVATGKAPSLEPQKQMPDDKSIPRFDYTEGLVHCLKAAASMRVMATYSDLGGDIFGFAHPKSHQHKHAIILFDEYPGGLGFSEKAYEFLNEIIQNAGNLLKNCACNNGCPACVGDHRINKHLILWALRSFYKEVPLPSNIQIDGLVQYQNKPQAKMPWKQLEENWQEVLNRFDRENLFGARFLKQSSLQEIKSSKLILYFSDSSLKLAQKPDVIEGIQSELSKVIDLPEHFELLLRPDDGEVNLKNQLKLQRMMSNGKGYLNN
ncbi:DEAD/DEAH box helicase [Marinifilum sp. N1E240]|uniref:DEAD/DEAH box helicase n=1 Tax=Marinifilum sp. N1E240 TaxID=2608082 RepID=UPI00128C966B|nr:DEAD/DEAH box helicase [Marinifilum sp. N1E240]MPQ48876.1 DEAD/DEAH box helicase [Marinifilum sp. N1E240]